jgi:hypothetical protein
MNLVKQKNMFDSIRNDVFILGFHLEEYAASKGRYPPIKRRMKRSLYVCTIEKANSLINSLIEKNRMPELGIVVVDEVYSLIKTEILNFYFRFIL